MGRVERGIERGGKDYVQSIFFTWILYGIRCLHLHCKSSADFNNLESNSNYIIIEGSHSILFMY